MALTKYKKKRDFDKTPEPSGETESETENETIHETAKKGKTSNRGRSNKPVSAQLRYVVQEHQASHLHYDFRLELDGVLKSWAVPKGPSMDPEVKRLAVMVEDHPLDYIKFEGKIPIGSYGAGTVRVWDEGVYYSEDIKAGLHKGHINFVLLGDKLKGLFSLVKIAGDGDGDGDGDGGHKNNWLLIKQKDDYAKSGTMRTMPHDIRPMLAQLHDKPFNRSGWIFEIKWDGYRAVTEIEGGKIRLYSRRGNSFAKKYPTIMKALGTIEKDAVLDGEIVALTDGKPDFHALQNYEDTPAPLQYVLFDLLYYDGEDFRERPLLERKARLREIIRASHDKTLVYSDHVETKGRDFYELVKRQGYEGMVAKEADSVYIEGKRTPHWQKFKYKTTDEAVIIGYTAPRGSRKRLGALVLGAYEKSGEKSGKNKGQLTYVGHSGGGFTDKELRDLHALLSKEKIKKPPIREKIPVNSPITWVRPKYVCEIEFSEWTPDGRMRHPIWKGLREDKTPEEVAIEKSIQTHRDKTFWPKEGYTKGEVLDYYDKIAPTILPYLHDRPESLNRHPNGIGGKNFFQKDVSNLHLPDFVETAQVWSESNDKEIKYLLCQNKNTLLYIANLGCIEINPWNSRKQSLDRPDYIIIDLDPGDNSFDEVVRVAQVAHKVLDQACAGHYVKTSGKTGLHIYIPLGARYDYDTARQFSELLVNIIHKKIPEITSLERSPAKRKNKIYVDWLQNRRGQTLAAPYSLRPYPGATVSTPLHWREVKKGLDPAKFNIKTIWKRLEKFGDIWEPLHKGSLDIKASMQCLEKNLNQYT